MSMMGSEPRANVCMDGPGVVVVKVKGGRMMRRGRRSVPSAPSTAQGRHDRASDGLAAQPLLCSALLCFAQNARHNMPQQP